MQAIRKVLSLLSLVILVALPFGAAAQGNSRTPITVENAAQLEQLIRLGRGSADFVQVSADGSTIVVGGSVGVWLYAADALDTETEPDVILTTATVRNMVFAADADLVMTSTNSGARLWDVASGTESAFVSGSMGQTTTISPDASTLAYAGSGSTVILHDVASDEELAQLSGHSNTINDLVFSADGSLLVSASSDGTVRVWDVASQSEKVVMSEHTSAVNAADISADGLLVASGSGDRTVRLWDAGTGAELATFEGESTQFAPVNIVRLSPDASIVVSGHNNGNLRFFDTSSAQEIASIDDAHRVGIVDIAFFPDGNRVVTVGNDNTIMLWDVASAELIAEAVGHMPRLGGITFNPDSTKLAIGAADRSVHLWDTVAATELNLEPNVRIEDAATSVSSSVESSIAWSHDGSMLAVLDGFGVKLYNADGNFLIQMRERGLSDSVVFSPDDSLLVYVTSEATYVFGTADGQRQLLITLDDHNGWVNNVAFSPDQTLIATRGDDNTVRVYAIP